MNSIDLTTELKQLITAEQAWYYSIVPKSNGSNLVFFIDSEKYSDNVKDELELLFGREVVLEKATTETIKITLGKYYRRNDINNKQHQTEIQVGNHSEDFLTNLINEASEIKASDIHIENYKERCRVRLRIDGRLIERYTIDPAQYPSLVNKIKIKAGLDIAEKRLPQDGRIFHNSRGKQFDIRVSSLPSLHGEKIVMRLLSKDSTEIDINQLGFEKKQLEDYLEGLKKLHGIILISGPTGSGKTTTLYATLKILNSPETNILTIEDPIEYTLEGVNQVQLKENIGLGFASALRTFLRQDPDIIMLGEIRDQETAQMSIRAALTGHLVLSTVHTNSAWGTVSRLIDMGVPPFLLADTLNLSIAQRLVRKLCPRCKKVSETALDQKTLRSNQNIKLHFEAVGCEHCFFTGYKGRRAIYEVLPVNNHLAENIKNQEYSIHDYLKKYNIKSMREIVLEMLVNGDTSLSEAMPILLSSEI